MSQSLERITYVEDEPDIRTIAEIALTTVGGFNVDTCSCGKEALDRAPGFGPDLVLLDVMMPEMDGPEVFRQLRKSPDTSETPVVFMTAKVQPAEVAEYLSLGAIGVISKPFDPITLADELRAIWNDHRKAA